MAPFTRFWKRMRGTEAPPQGGSNKSVSQLDSAFLLPLGTLHRPPGWSFDGPTIPCGTLRHYVPYKPCVLPATTVHLLCHATAHKQLASKVTQVARLHAA